MNLNLRNARLEKGMMQSELAEKTGIKQQNISMYEQGKVVPSVKTAAKIAKVLGKTMEELFCTGLSIPVMGNVPQRQHESDCLFHSFLTFLLWNFSRNSDFFII